MYQFVAITYLFPCLNACTPVCGSCWGLPNQAVARKGWKSTGILVATVLLLLLQYVA